LLLMPLFNNSNEVTAYCKEVVGVVPPDKKQLALFIVIGVLFFQLLILAYKCWRYRKLIPPEQRPPSLLDIIKTLLDDESKENKGEVKK